MTIAFTVLGIPQPGGSKRAFIVAGRARVTDANAKAAPWKATVASAARLAVGDSGRLLTGPLVLNVRFFFPRPAGHYGSGKNADKLKASAPAHKITKPDGTKLFRALEDALTGVVWRDDSQVVEQLVSKCWGEPARAEVVIDTLDPGDAEPRKVGAP